MFRFGCGPLEHIVTDIAVCNSDHVRWQSVASVGYIVVVQKLGK